MTQDYVMRRAPEPVTAGVDPLIAKYIRLTDRELYVLLDALGEPAYKHAMLQSPAREHCRQRLVDQLVRVLEYRQGSGD